MKIREMNESIEDIILSRVLPIVEEKMEERMGLLRRQMARRFLYTKVSAGELADIVNLSRNSVHRKVAKGELPSELVNGNHLFDLRVIMHKANECNFKNVGAVREAIQNWMDEKINDLT